MRIHISGSATTRLVARVSSCTLRGMVNCAIVGALMSLRVAEKLVLGRKAGKQKKPPAVS